MVRKCAVCGNTNKPFFEFPSDTETRMKWIEAVQNFADISRIGQLPVLCRLHFDDKCFNTNVKVNRLIKGATPSLFNTAPSCEVSTSVTPISAAFHNQNSGTNSIGVQVESISCDRIKYLEKRCKYLELQLNRTNDKYLECSLKVRNLEEQMNQLYKNFNCLNKISEDTEQSDEVYILG